MNTLDVINQVYAKGNTQKHKNPTDPKTIFIDPYNIGSYVGARAKPSAIGYAVLRAMAIRCKPVAAIIHTRQNQVARFAKRPAYDGDTGFKIRLKDIDAKPTDADKKEMRRLEEAFMSTGTIPNLKRKDNFDAFLRKVTRDSLVLDALTYELVPNRKGELVEWWAVDGSTIEVVSDMALPNVENTVYQPVTPKGILEAGHIAYVQRVFGDVAAEYTERELAYGIRNPRTDIEYALFGLSELEEMIDIVTHILNATSYNGGYFTENNLPQGVLEIVGKYEDEHLESFKRAWENLITGSVKKWKVPILALEEGNGFKFTPFKQSSKDMEFHMWLDFLNTIACAVYQIDPMEIGFKAWQPLGVQGQFNSSAEKTRSDNSQSKGFFPLMQFLSGNFNAEIMPHLGKDFAFEWVGLNEDDRVKKEEMRNQRLTNGFSIVAEERAAEDKRSMVDIYMQDAGMSKEEAQKAAIWTFAPANPQLAQVFTQYMQGTQSSDQQNAEHGFAKEMNQTTNQQSVEQMKLAHTQKLEAQGYSHEQATEMADKKFKFDDEQASKAHGRALEMGAVGHEQQTELMGKQQQFQDEQGQKAHGRQLELGAASHEQQAELMSKQQQFTDSQGNKAHARSLEAGALKHEQNKELLSSNDNGTDTTGKEKKGRSAKLRKSLLADDDVLTIEITLDD